MKKSELRRMIREALFKRLHEAPDDETPKLPEVPNAPGVPKEKEKKLAPPADDPDAQQQGQSPADIAHHLKLTYAGYRNWQDSSGATVAKTMGNHLVKVDKNHPSNKAPQGSDVDPYSGDVATSPSGPVKPTGNVDTDDPYSNPGPLRGTRKPAVKASAIDPSYGTQTPEKSGDVKSASSDGGDVTFKGHVSTSGQLVGSKPVTDQDLTRATRDASGLEKRIGKDGAMRKVRTNLEALQAKRKQLAGHNTNSSQERLTALEKLDDLIGHQTRIAKLLLGKPVAEPGQIEPPQDEGGNPLQVTTHDGRSGIIDFFLPDTAEAHVTFDDGKYGVMRQNELLPKRVNPEAQARKDVPAFYGDPGPGNIPEHKTLRESEANDQAVRMGLQYISFGRYIDPATGKVVAKSINGKLTRVEPEDPEPMNDLDPKVDAAMSKLFKQAGQQNYQPAGLKHVSPGWNRDRKMSEDDIPFDAHAEDTVKKLLAMIGDPKRLVLWLLKKFREETPNGKKRILQYLGVLKDMGVMPAMDAENAGSSQKSTDEFGDSPFED